MNACIFLAVFLGLGAALSAQPFVHSIDIPQGTAAPKIIELAAQVVPSPRQVAYQGMNFTCFIHIGINTFTGKEWGSGTESPQVFQPGETLDTDQWCRVAKAAGMKMMMITVKHHDGFCLWQTRYNKDFSVKTTSWREGKGDVLRELSQSCRKHGLKLGVYLSPADLFQMEHATGIYGNGSKVRPSVIPSDPTKFLSDPTQVRADRPTDAPIIRVEADDYNRYFMNQLYELLTEYGPIHEVWFDGAHPKQKGNQQYNKNAWFSLIRQLAPEAVIFGGPDVRWCGNEAGGTREAEWNVLPISSLAESGVDRPQKDIATDAELVKPEYEVYGKKYQAKSLYYIVPEVDVSIREGWFWRNEDEQKVRSADDVFDIYERAAGGNSVFLLNVPPNRNGVFAARDVATLEEVGRRIRATYEENSLMTGARSESAELLDGKLDTYWQAKERSCQMELRLPAAHLINRFVVAEAVGKVGQRVGEHALDGWVDGKWQEVARGRTIGFRKILRFPAVSTDRFRLRVLQSRLAPALAECSVHYYATPLPTPTASRDAQGKVSITVAEKVAAEALSIVYTIDGSTPTASSTRYEKAFDFATGGVLKICVFQAERQGPIAEQRFGFSQSAWKVIDCSSEQDGTYAAKNAIDENTSTYWHTSWKAPVPPHPHHLTVDMGTDQMVGGFTYLPRQDRQVPDSMVEHGSIAFSRDGKTWSSPEEFRFGNLVNDPSQRAVLFGKKQSARYFRFTSLEGAAGKSYAGAAEIGILP